MPLNDRQARFAEEFLVDLNGTVKLARGRLRAGGEPATGPA
jgi:hypothetical protein